MLSILYWHFTVGLDFIPCLLFSECCLKGSDYMIHWVHGRLHADVSSLSNQFSKYSITYSAYLPIPGVDEFLQYSVHKLKREKVENIVDTFY